MYTYKINIYRDNEQELSREQALAHIQAQHPDTHPLMVRSILAGAESQARYQLDHTWYAGWHQTESKVWVYYTKER